MKDYEDDDLGEGPSDQHAKKWLDWQLYQDGRPIDDDGDELDDEDFVDDEDLEDPSAPDPSDPKNWDDGEP